MPRDAATPTAQVLIIDDEADHADVMADALRKPGHICTVRHSLDEARVELEGGHFDVIVTDLMMHGRPDGMTILAEARTRQPGAKTIMVTAHGDIPTAKEAIRGGAYDFIEKPLDLEVFRNLVNRAAEAAVLRAQVDALSEQLGQEYSLQGIVGASPAMRQVVRTLGQIAPTDIPVLLIGETGTGKDLVARVIHQHSRRAKQRFKPVNCAAFTESLLESELFGHVKGAFTGAEKNTEGVFEYANGGTLFLDEIGDMPLGMQSKLLRVLESGEVVRVGSNEPRTVDVRFVSATHRDLESMVKDETFRQDLFFRIKGAEIRLPPLRERREDIPLLAQHQINVLNQRNGRNVVGLSDQAAQRMMAYDWPGNVRQLNRVIELMCVFAEDGGELEAAHLPAEITGAAENSAGGSASLAGIDLAELEKRAIRETLKLTGGNREQTAKMLGIGERTLYRLLKEYGLR
ncbi:MAG: sigma-54-dependent Fis family transcriptional regulator [Phycisphaerales bacterium]|nr:sigma-54-dependent Fis family transcriptional regulator [Phycisphaerales bacterium]